ncbi:very short patch repair endonuclease [Sinorhizobium fredii]|uniref:very short patch repair endonuclease n=1 Tax=Rhizobium fredii TaxID=380 RepID=UPI001295AACC|nr:very short patch repair endonuclease [Sinorhizobium fredii]MQW99593.1 DNA mismatch endonuclease Vsr [Sinorhizobium fredii]
MPETAQHRSWTMSQVKSKDTSPEMTVRRLLHSMGYRYRLHGKNLPGKPDLVFAGRKKVIFIHGCFWHGHDCKRGARIPSTRQDYWLAKVGRNKERDARNVSSLEQAGWSVLTVWECELKDRVALAACLTQFLGGPQSFGLPPPVSFGRSS